MAGRGLRVTAAAPPLSGAYFSVHRLETEFFHVRGLIIGNGYLFQAQISPEIYIVSWNVTVSIKQEL